MTELSSDLKETFDHECEIIRGKIRQLFWDGNSIFGLGLLRDEKSVSIVKVQEKDVEHIKFDVILFANVENVDSQREQIISKYYENIGIIYDSSLVQVPDEEWMRFGKNVIENYKGCYFFHQLLLIDDPMFKKKRFKVNWAELGKFEN